MTDNTELRQNTDNKVRFSAPLQVWVPILHALHDVAKWAVNIFTATLSKNTKQIIKVTKNKKYHGGGVVRCSQRVDGEALLLRVICSIQAVEVLVARYHCNTNKSNPRLVRRFSPRSSRIANSRSETFGTQIICWSET